MGKFTIRDSIHNEIELDHCHKQAISHPLFQRLRRIAQNGLLYLIFPGMRHSRFEHSLGAAHLAGKLYDKIEIEEYSVLEDIPCVGGPTLLFSRSKNALVKMKADPKWREIFVMAALLHDIGHGPLSHTFDELGLLNNKSFDLTSVNNDWLNDYFKKIMEGNEKIDHEDISLAYLHEILSAIGPEWRMRLLYVGFLINKKYRDFVLAKSVLFSEVLDESSTDILRLLSPYISGFFDVDRLDYLDRDSTMAGVSYGLVETDRILTSVRSLLSEKKGILTTQLTVKAKRFHMLDHFLVCLYEMYTQLYNHPCNIQTQYEIKILVEKIQKHRSFANEINLEWHKTASDESLLSLIREHDSGILDKILFRRYKESGKSLVLQIYSKSSKTYNERLKEGWLPLETHGRHLLKDGAEVWLIDHFEQGQQPEVFDWSADSLVASKLSGTTYEPVILWRNKAFESDIANLDTKFSSREKKKDVGFG